MNKPLLKITFHIAIALGLLTTLTGCPPLTWEGVWGYNAVVLKNESSVPIVTLYVTPSGAPSKGVNYVDAPNDWLLPGETLVVTGLENGTYTLELEYADGDTDGSEQLSSVSLYWGETFFWYWYGPEEEAAQAPEASEAL